MKIKTEHTKICRMKQKLFLKGIVLKVYISKEVPKINYPSIYLKNLEKEEQIKLKIEVKNNKTKNRNGERDNKQRKSMDDGYLK